MLSHGHQLNFRKNNKSTTARGRLKPKAHHLFEKLASQIVKKSFSSKVMEVRMNTKASCSKDLWSCNFHSVQPSSGVQKGETFDNAFRACLELKIQYNLTLTIFKVLCQFH